ncbi:AAA family ATPase [Enterovibrio norvegicus]|uniref:AAA family ATPase n=1 Tax=Enterovibrio norvegicus TaxID=188144 RepID=UPI000C85795C|nr:AAA family ATPase [Enterovibrio norvegicus]PMH64533.1 hypothetical protein BCU62_15880 [Enterovibrio norvegicus]
MNITSCTELLAKAEMPKTHIHVLKGLLSGHVGMMLAAPGIGKSRLAMSIAIEVAANYPVIGVSGSSEPIKTLFISSEDVEDILIERMTYIFNHVPADKREVLAKHLDFSTDIEPIVSPPEVNNEDFFAAKANVDKLKNIFSDYKLVIIDTISEVIGSCDEVRHDRHIKNTLKDLAESSGAAILVIHHINKEDIRGRNKLSMASGSGLSTLMRLSKYQIGMVKNDGELQLQFLKHNYLKQDEISPITLTTSAGGFITASSVVKPGLKEQSDPIIQANEPKPHTPKTSNKAPTKSRVSNEQKRVNKEPDSIELDISGQDSSEDLRGVI